MKIAIIGLGLIGGSWAMALREWAKTEEGQAAKLELVGFDAKGKQKMQAHKMGLCDSYTATPMDAVKGAQIVIVATPVMSVRDTFEDIAEYLEPGAIVTDTCSTKRQVMQWANELLPTTVSFIGGHPMAGKTASLEEAEPNLFQNCTYCLMSSPRAHENALDNIIKLVEIIGAKPFFIDPQEHDSYVAAISHLPFVVAASLVNTPGDSEGWREINRLASSGFRDTTRLAGGGVTMHVDICRTNSDALISWIDRFQDQLSQLRELIQSAGLYDERGRPRTDAPEDSNELSEYFERASETRERWLNTREKDNQVSPTAVEMPSKKDIGVNYSRLLFGGLFDRRRPDDKNNPPNKPK